MSCGTAPCALAAPGSPDVRARPDTLAPSATADRIAARNVVPCVVEGGRGVWRRRASRCVPAVAPVRVPGQAPTGDGPHAPAAVSRLRPSLRRWVGTVEGSALEAMQADGSA